VELLKSTSQPLLTAALAAHVAEESPLHLVVIRNGKVYAGDGRWQYIADIDAPREWMLGVRASLLLSALKSLQSYPWNLQYNDAQIHLSDSAGTKISLQTSALDRYPQGSPGHDVGDLVHSWDSALFHDALNNTAYAAATEDSRAALGCVALWSKAMKATDGYRLAEFGNAEDTDPVLLPAQAVKLLRGWDGEIKIYRSPQTVTLTLDDLELRMTGVPEQYPDITLEHTEATLTVDRDELLNLLKTTQMFRQQPGYLHTRSGKLCLRLQGPSQGVLRKSIDASIESRCDAMMNLQYLREAVSRLETGTINMTLRSDGPCCVWQAGERHWIMPYRGRG
jgi:DNA polymerase III sliding clamp (beta) subunit (PCNA family)